MKVWFDILHIPQYNFYKNIIKNLAYDGFVVYVTVINRGSLFKIVCKELDDINNVYVIKIGEHKLNKISAVFHANLIRIHKINSWLRDQCIDVAMSNGVFTSFLGWCYNIPNYAFDDDPQVWDYKPKMWFSVLSHYCIYEPPKNFTLSNKVVVLRVLKEWSYLCPNVFKADVAKLLSYGLNSKEYIFIREVSVGTVNYAGQGFGAVKNIKHLIPKDKKVLFSLEEKNRRNEYPDDWILLQEPVDDIHSLIYYSAGLVSSGDSMAREAALLGIPAYYLGIRHSMPANLAASKVANLQNEKTMPFSEWVKTLNVSAEDAVKKQEELRAKIDSEFIDINDYMMSLVEKHRK